MKPRNLLSVILAFGLLALVAITLSSIVRPRTPLAEAGSITFVGMTNAPAGGWPFGLFSVSNKAWYAIRVQLTGFEVEGDNGSDVRARIVNRSLPESLPAPRTFFGRGAIITAFGEPGDVDPGVRWRPVVEYSRYDWQDRYRDFAMQRRWPLKIGPFHLVSPRVIDLARVSGPWLTNVPIQLRPAQAP